MTIGVCQESECIGFGLGTVSVLHSAYYVIVMHMFLLIIVLFSVFVTHRTFLLRYKRQCNSYSLSYVINGLHSSLTGIAAAFLLSLQGLSWKSCAFIMICEILVIISVFLALTFFFLHK